MIHAHIDRQRPSRACALRAYIHERVGKIDLVLACGDLPEYYLEYIIGLLDAPLCYVHGNHDDVKLPDPQRLVNPGNDVRAFEWGTNVHGRPVRLQGLLVAGLEGCRRYKPHAPFQYSDLEVRWQVSSLVRRLVLNRLRYGRYLDVLITHAPPDRHP